MVVGVVSFELSLPGCRSLKAKRSVVKSIRERIRNRFNASVAETAYQDVWTRAELTVAVVATDRRGADSVLDHIDTFIVEDGRAVLSGVRRELL